MSFPWLEPLFDKLLRQYQRGHLHHAILLHSSVKQLAKGQLAVWLAHALLCTRPQPAACGECKSCQLLNADSHPDFLQIRSDTSISVAQIRQLVAAALQKSQQSGAQVFIVERCEKMTESAANALLKTLEEPGQQKYFILTSDAPARLLATIKSRCQLYSVTPPSLESLNDWLQDKGIDKTQFSSLYPEFAASPLQALTLLEQQAADKKHQLLNDFKAFLSGRIGPLQLATHFDESLFDEQLDWLITALQLWLKKQAENKPKTPLSLKICAMQNSLIQVKMQVLNSGVNKKVLFQAACVEMSNLLRG
ncbi:DNA polymerase III subunit delta' [Gayadomonas joobiniege]|uniref:DNA polymerase III subunit delta' n=1 Tax=Gayadomonas joobiniege TaxID=1234606 RepID=UPI000371A0F6|nr:DNA polymerase III subunit delta' [Gayadomonas joobiniege]